MQTASLTQLGVLLFVVSSGCSAAKSGGTNEADAGAEAGVDAATALTASHVATSAHSSSEPSVHPTPTSSQSEAGASEDAGHFDSGEPANTAESDASPITSHDVPDTSTPAASNDSSTSPGSPDAAADSGNPDAGSYSPSNVPVITCNTQSPLSNATCDVTAGNGARLITGTILRPSDVLVGGQVLIDGDGVITCAACDCSAAPGAASATKLNCPTGVVSPGLINAHEHITYNRQAAPHTDTGYRYDSRSEWRTGENNRTQLAPVLGSASADQIRWSELRFLFGGVTSMVGSGGISGLVRNLDRAATADGLDVDVDYETFPLDDSDGTRNTSSCSYGSAVEAQDFASAEAFIAEVASGDDVYAHNEFLCTSGLGSGVDPGNDLLTSRTGFVHAMALTASDYALMATRGSSLIWTPRSNFFLYGNTAGIAQAVRLGVRIALGTEWLATGSMNLLRELKCADTFSHVYLDDALSDYQLWQTVTWNGARVTGTGDSIGALLPGRVGDIAIFDGRSRQQHRAVIEAEPQDVVLVMRGGKALYGDAALVAAIPGTETCEALSACDSDKLLCLEGEVASGQTLATLSTAMSAIYPALLCNTPEGEPPCTPSRSESVNGSTTYTGSVTDDDADGDGIANAEDNCPNVFNPVRPMDNGIQPDADADNIGDACDVCPLSTATSCDLPNPNEGDNDGVLDWNDNCPEVANPQQTDTDADGKGDACDVCPDIANPGSAACPVSIYDIKTGVVPEGSAVSISGALVTARHQQGFFVQLTSTDTDYAGPEYSGIFVALSGNSVTVGDRVTIASASVTDFFGQLELSAVTGVSVLSSGEAAPNPVLTTSAEVATGGSAAAELEGVLIQIDDVTVTALSPAAGSGDSLPTNEFVVDNALRVNDYFYLVSPFPTDGQDFDSIVGVLRYANGNTKLEPRDASDFE